MITMLLGGLWHGAGWKFAMWGALHGGGWAGGFQQTAPFTLSMIGALVLTLFVASRSLPSWADQPGDGGLTPLVRAIALGWNRRIAPPGLTCPYRELPRVLNWLREQQRS